MGIAFEVVVSGVQEMEEGPAEAVALENARRKAEAVAPARPDQLVLGVDTVVALDGRLYGKPADRAEAAATLQALAGREHQVTSAVCLIGSRRARQTTAVTSVSFRALDEGMMSWYLDSEEWRDRAGGYAIQGRGAALIAGIHGDYLNVVGLPIGALLSLEPALLGG
ncbi:MAG TPA: Maf family protein [Solirubrobacteraceae bacterium]|nr:Maf family protein [Solirubrobacteraceae bacterium]